MQKSIKWNTSRSVAIAERDMMNEGFAIKTKHGDCYAPVIYYTGKTYEEVFEKIMIAVDKVADTDKRINTINIGYVGFKDINSAITKDGSGYKAFASVAGTIED